MSLRTRPLFTEIVRETYDFRPDPGMSYIYGRSDEPRSSHVEDWASEATDIRLVEVEYGSDNSFRLDNATFNLRGTEQLNQFWSDRSSATAYLDITGLPHHVWAPLLRAGLGVLHSLRVVYAEPKEYRFHPSPTPGEIFDLSTRISGIARLRQDAWSFLMIAPISPPARPHRLGRWIASCSLGRLRFAALATLQT